MAEVAPASTNAPFWDSFQILEGQHWIHQGWRGRGHFEFSGRLRFSGEWVGDIRASHEEAQLHIEKEAQVSGEILVPRLSVAGNLKDVRVQARWVKVLAGGLLTGHIEAETLIVEEGGCVQGRIITRRGEG